MFPLELAMQSFPPSSTRRLIHFAEILWANVVSVLSQHYLVFQEEADDAKGESQQSNEISGIIILILQVKEPRHPSG